MAMLGHDGAIFSRPDFGVTLHHNQSWSAA
jgi:hypothetical protein